MKKLLEMQRAQSERREQINTLQRKADASEAEQTELRTLESAYTAAESDYRGLLAAEVKRQGELEAEALAGGNGDGMPAEIRGLLRKSETTAVIDAVIQQRQIDGPTAELQAAYKVGANTIPWAMFLDTEQRADATVTAPASADNQHTLRPIAPVLFPGSVGDFMGVERPRVPVGAHGWPIVTAPTDMPGPVAKAAAVADTDVTFDVESLEPARIQRSITINREDLLGTPGLESAMRRLLQDNIGAALDNNAVNLAAEGLVKFGTAPTIGAQETYATYRARIMAGIDGKHANVPGDIRALIGIASLVHMDTEYRTNNSEDSALDTIARLTGGVRSSALIAAVASKKQHGVLRLGSNSPAAVQPLWSGVEIVRDDLTLSTTGQVRFLVRVFQQFRIVRPGGYKRVIFQTVA